MQLHVPVPGVETPPLAEQHALLWGTRADGRIQPLAALTDDGLALAYEWRTWQNHILTEEYASSRRRPLYTRCPISYRIVPAGLRHRLAVRMCTNRRKDTIAFPATPFDGGFEALRHVVRRFSLQSLPTPPSPRICLTHDVDTQAGFRFVERIAEVECSLGLRSSWNIVVHEYPHDRRVLDWLVDRGFEIGLHDCYHDNRLIYLAEDSLRRRLDTCRPFIDRYHVRGFRSPSWLRNAQLFRVLVDYVSYDASCLDFDWLCPAGRGGVLTATPFAIEGLIELPTTLPFEAPLLTGLELAAVPAYWRPKIEWLRQVQGQAVVNTHPDPHYLGNEAGIRVYARFLQDLLEAFQGRWSLPADLAAETSHHA